MVAARDPALDPLVESEEDSGEDEEESSTEEQNEGSESEPEPEPPRNQVSKTTKKPITQPADSSSDDDEESESETDSDSPVKKLDTNIKPIASKPMDGQRTPSVKARSKPNSTTPASPAKTPPVAGAKRSALAAAGTADGDAKEAKRPKKKSEMGVEGSEKKGNTSADSKKLFQRLWSEDDEVAILNGMMDYQEKKKADPLNDLNDFHEFIKKLLHVDVSKQQFQDKIRRLKKKFENNSDKEKKGKQKLSSKAHEQICYELSKRIWGNGSDYTTESPKVNGSRGKTAVTVTFEAVEQEQPVKEDNNLGCEESLEGLKGVHFGLGSSGLDRWIANYGMNVIKGEKREELEEKWKMLKVEEIEIFAKKLKLMLEQTTCVLEAVKSSGV